MADRRDEMFDALVGTAPFAADEPFRVVQLCAGDGVLTSSLLTAFPRATILVLDGDEKRRDELTQRFAGDAARVRLRPFDVATLDWWDLLFGADLVVAAECLHALNDAKRQYLYKAVADRVSERGAFLIADRLDRELLHQLIWLKHAGFARVDCWWRIESQAVFGGIRRDAGQVRASAPPLRADS